MADQPYWNPSDKDTGNTLSNSDRTSTQAASNAGGVRSTAYLTTGKWYVEIVVTNDNRYRTGVANSSYVVTANPGDTANSWTFRGGDGAKYHNAVADTAYWGTPTASGDVLMIAVDVDDHKIWWGVNGTWGGSGNPATASNPAYTNLSASIALLFGSNASSGTKVNTLTDIASYTYSPPSGFTAGWGGDAAINLDVTPTKGTVSIAGKAATILATTNQNLQLTSGAVAVTGQPAAFTSAPLLTAAAGSVVLSGQSASITADAVLAPATGAVLISGQPTVIETGSPLIVTAAAGAVIITGQPAAVETTDTFIGEPVAGSVLIEGQPVTLIEGQGLEVTPSAGAVLIEGQPVTVLAGTPGVVEAAAGQVAVTGQPVTVRADVVLSPATAEVTISGRPASVIAETNAVLSTGAGSVLVVGKPATITLTSNIILEPAFCRVTFGGKQAWVETSDNGGTVVVMPPPSDRGGQTWREIVMKADPDWPVHYRRSEGVYEFGKRRFDESNPYG